MSRFIRGSENLRSWWMILIGTTASGLFLVFWLPTRVPSPPIVSESFLFGFNNRLCEILFYGVVIVVAILSKVGRLQFPSPRRDASLGDGGLTSRLICWCLLIAACLCGLIYFLAYGIGGINDGSYYLDRIHLMARGMVPYRDFEFVYGSAPLYAAIFIGHGLHLSLENAYYLIWGSGTLLGIFLLWVSIGWLELPAGGKRTTFLLLYIVLLLLIPLGAINYFSLRYTLPIFAITGMCRLDRDGLLLTRAKVIVFVVAMMAILLELSPEEGLVYGIAACIYLPVRRYYARTPFVMDTLVIVASFSVICAIAARAGTFATMKRLGAGAFNLPVYPGPNILFAFAAVLGMVFYLATGTAAQRLRSNVAFAVLYGLGMLPGALGRCDTGHIVGYLMAPLSCVLLLSWIWPSVWRGVTLYFVAGVIVLPLALSMWLDPPVMSKIALSHLYRGGGPQGRLGAMLDHLTLRIASMALGKERGIAKVSELRNSYLSPSIDPRQVFPGSSAVIAVPFEYRPNKLSIYQSPSLKEGYFMGLLNVETPADVETKIAELRREPEADLVASRENLDDCEAQHGSEAEIRRLLLLPWVPHPRNESKILQPYCDYVLQHYYFVYPASPSTFGYGLMRRRPQE